MRAPSAGVPLPGGRPEPSGSTLMSQAAMSAGLIGFPRLGVWAKATLALRASVSVTANPRRLRIYMLHLPAALDRPTGDRVVVLTGEAGHRRNSRGFAARRHQLGSGRLLVAGLVPRSALQYRRAAVPSPRHAESSERLVEDRLLQCRLRPALAAVGGHHDFCNAAVARVGEAGNLIESWPLQRKPGRRMGDEGFDLLDEIKPICLPARQDRRIGPGFIESHARLIRDLYPPQEFRVHVAFPAGQEQPPGIAVSRHDPLAILVERDHGVIHGFGERHAAA